MCGICGFIRLRPEGPDLAHLRAMNDAMWHRGPDDAGEFADEQVFLAMRRLSIIDLSGGHQPMHDEAETLVVVFNGEIYNYRDLRWELEAQGFQFRTQSDTETFLHGYHAWGMEGLLQKLNGMFGFCLYDRKAQRIFLGRDRAGEKPIYYYCGPGGFFFASELQVLTRTRSAPRRLNQEALALYLLHQYVPGPRTLLEGVFKLPQATYLQLEVPSLQFELKRYWHIAQEALPLESLQEAKPLLKELLSDSVKRRLQADVPLGAFLSGGIDSSINVGLMAQFGSHELNTFSIGFEHASFDESPYSRLVAERFGTTHHHFLLDPQQLQFLLPRVLAALDEPVADAAAIPTFWLCQESRKYVKVVLTGEGADELFAGYSYYHQRPPLPEPLGWRRRFKQWWGTPKPSLFQSIPDALSGFPLMATPAAIASLFTQPLEPESLLQALHRQHSWPGSPLERAQYYDIATWLPDDLLMKVDKMSMANSLEARAPFLDHRLIEFSFRLAGSLKVQAGQVKYLLRESFAELLPLEILQREKHGFNLPMHLWLRHELRDLVNSTLAPEALKRSGVLQASVVQQVLSDFFEKQAPCERLVYALYVFQEWWERLAEQKTN